MWSEEIQFLFILLSHLFLEKKIAVIEEIMDSYNFKMLFCGHK